jgi:hypothetical protein
MPGWHALLPVADSELTIYQHLLSQSNKAVVCTERVIVV